MKIDSASPTSRRGYLSQSELEQFANINIIDSDEADDVISQAEELIDNYVKRANKFINRNYTGVADNGTTTTLTDSLLDNLAENFFSGCELEIVGGINAGERRRITTSKDGVLTISQAFSSAIDDTSAYKIFQLGLFPRYQDVFYKSGVYYKSIPEAIKRATAAQVEFIIDKGDEYFSGPTDYTSEQIGDYSYTRKLAGEESMIAPKAKMFLKGFINRVGILEVENPTNLF